MSITLSKFLTDNADVRCPWCGGGNLQHGKITAFNSSQEDSEHIIRTIIDNEVTTTSLIQRKGSGNPSSRRHGLVIDFSCENCSEASELTIAQQKGATALGWRRRAR